MWNLLLPTVIGVGTTAAASAIPDVGKAIGQWRQGGHALDFDWGSEQVKESTDGGKTWKMRAPTNDDFGKLFPGGRQEFLAEKDRRRATKKSDSAEAKLEARDQRNFSLQMKELAGTLEGIRQQGEANRNTFALGLGQLSEATAARQDETGLRNRQLNFDMERASKEDRLNAFNAVSTQVANQNALLLNTHARQVEMAQLAHANQKPNKWSRALDGLADGLLLPFALRSA
jgi:hypothetical protein